jgi:lipoate-protein ligase A
VPDGTNPGVPDASPAAPAGPHEQTVNEDLLDRYLRTRVPVSRIYEPRELCAVLGAAGRPEQDLLLGALEADGVPWRWRRGGGGTVILGPGQVVLALVTEVLSPFRNREYAGQINGWIVEALESLGVRGAGLQGISDLAIRGRKIVGTSIYRTRLVLFYQASLLVSNDVRLFTRYLAMPRRVPEYRAGRSHEDFCTTLAREGYEGSTDEVIRALERVLSARLPLLK